MECPATTKPDQSQKLRVRFIWDYSIRTSKRTYFTSIGLFLFGGIPLSLGVFNALRGLKSSSPIVLGLSLLVTLAFGFSALIIYIRVAVRFIPRAVRSSKPLRIERLNNLLDHPDGPTRFPHRQIEWRHYHVHEKTTALNAFVSKLEPGDVIVMNCPRSEIDSLAQRSKIAFEPIPWRRLERRVQWLASTTVDPAKGDDASRRRMHRRQRFKDILLRELPSWTFAIGLVGVTFFKCGWIQIGTVLAVLGIACLAALCLGHHHILVPGGLVQLRNGLIFRSPRLDFFTFRNAALVIYANGSAYLSSQGRSSFLPCDEKMAAALLAAWLSEARAPTMQELRTLLTPECGRSPRAVSDS